MCSDRNIAVGRSRLHEILNAVQVVVEFGIGFARLRKIAGLQCRNDFAQRCAHHAQAGDAIIERGAPPQRPGSDQIDGLVILGEHRLRVGGYRDQIRVLSRQRLLDSSLIVIPDCVQRFVSRVLM
jgi:hypothetical protein